MHYDDAPHSRARRAIAMTGTIGMVHAPPRYLLSADQLRIAMADESGIAICGRVAEIDALRGAGRQDPSLGRVFEGHINAAQLVARYGSEPQRAILRADILAGHLFAVWNTQGSDRLRVSRTGETYILTGAKTWTSGAGSVSRALVTAVWPDDSLQMCLVPLDRVRVEIDRSNWEPLGMERSDSFRVDFTGVELSAQNLIGQPSDYERQPWFFGGALRFLAVQTGIVERLATETALYLNDRHRQADIFQQTRAAHMRIAVQTCRCWLRECIDAWTRFDRAETEANAEAVIDMVDMARVVVERSALDVIEGAVRSVGALGLIEPHPFAHLVRDLQMYLRQPAPDAVLLRVGATAFREANAARSSVIASSTGTIG
jgi:alkylation response protein AidB-like acyl-CoA dehydrogenase